VEVFTELGGRPSSKCHRRHRPTLNGDGRRGAHRNGQQLLFELPIQTARRPPRKRSRDHWPIADAPPTQTVTGHLTRPAVGPSRPSAQIALKPRAESPPRLFAGRCRPPRADGHHSCFEMVCRRWPGGSATCPPSCRRTRHVQAAGGPCMCVPADFRCPTTSPPQPISSVSWPRLDACLVPVSARSCDRYGSRGRSGL
jgi:hypothetical protein